MDQRNTEKNVLLERFSEDDGNAAQSPIRLTSLLNF